MMKVDGVVILYHPSLDNISNVKEYACFLRVLYVFDNSECSNEDLVERLLFGVNYVYIWSRGENRGVAWALNAAAHRAISSGASFLLTMDQDSAFHSFHFERFLSESCQIFGDERVGAVAPLLVDRFVSLAQMGTEEKSIVATSGCIVRLSAFNLAGGYDERLFIDFVDYDFCLKLALRGYKVVRLRSILVEHKIGDLFEAKIGPFSLRTTNHSSIRRYYITRNRLYFVKRYARRYPRLCFRELLYIPIEICKILLIEDDKRKKLSMMLGGMGDFFLGRVGKYSEG